MIKTKKTNKNLIIFVTTLIVTFFFFSPLFASALRGYKPELRFTGDLQLQYWPAFIQTSKYFHDWVFNGIDFSVANGASSFFATPNMPVYYLPQLIFETIFNISNNDLAAKLFTFQLWLTGFSSMLFTTLWFNRIIRINVYYSLLGGALFFSIISYVMLYQTQFFYIASVFPVLMYCLGYSLKNETNIYQKLLLVMPFIVMLTAGYIPIAVMGITVAVIASPIIVKYVLKIEPRYKDFLRVLLIAIVLCAGYMVAIVKTFKQILWSSLNGPLSEGVYFADNCLHFKGAMTLFLSSLANDSGEGPHFRLGLPILLLFYFAYQHLKTYPNAEKKNILTICIFLFLSSLLLSMGTISGLADIFFYTVPGLGGMHIYARYMLIFVFFLIFGLIYALSEVHKSEKPFDLKIPSLIIVVTFVSMLLYPAIFTNNDISIPNLFIELLISVLVLLSINFKNNKKFVFPLMIALVLFQGSFVYKQVNWASFQNPGATSKDIVNSEARMSGLINYFYANSDKLLIKYLDLTPEIEKTGGVPHNFPWFVRYGKNDERRLSTYMVYGKLSQQKQYAMKFDHFTVYDKGYLLESGADYLIYDRKTQTKELTWLKTVINSKVPEYDIGNGFFAVKLLNAAEKNTRFDNGVFRVVSTDADLKIESFKTNWATKTELNFTASQSGTIYFELFPQKNLKFYLNNVKVEPVYLKTGLATFNFPAGQNKFLVSYRNVPMSIFLYTYLVYLLAVVAILIGYLWKVIRRHRFINKCNSTK